MIPYGMLLYVPYAIFIMIFNKYYLIAGVRVSNYILTKSNAVDNEAHHETTGVSRRLLIHLKQHESELLVA